MDVRNDEPIDSIVNDLFGFSFQASVIAKLVGGKDSKNHLSVGVSGSWGSGKTSLLNMVKEFLNYKQYKDEKERLERILFTKSYYRMSEDKRFEIDQRIIYLWAFLLKLEQEKIELEDSIINENKVIWFDPWFFGSQETVIKAFFYRISKELMSEDKELAKLFLKLAVVMSSSPRLPDSLPVVGDAFKVINYGRNLLSWMSGDDGSVQDFSDIKKKICERLKTEKFADYDDDDEKISKKRKKIVIIIDDLDRLQKDEALAMLKVIRLVTELGVNIVIGYDEETLSETINQHCSGYGREYIRKMINVPTYMPIPTKIKLEEYIKTNFERYRFPIPITTQTNDKVISVFWNTCTALTNTIRKAKHLINSFGQLINIYGLKQDNDLILGLLLLHLYFPVLFNRLKDKSPPFVEIDNDINFITNSDNSENQKINNEMFEKLMGQDSNIKKLAYELCSTLFSINGIKKKAEDQKYKKPMFKKDCDDLLSLIPTSEIE